MGQAIVRSHARRGHQVRTHTRQTNSSAVVEVLLRDMYWAYERIDQQGTTEQISSANPNCPPPGWYPIRRHLLDTPYEDSPILAYCCAASRPVVDGTE